MVGVYGAEGGLNQIVAGVVGFQMEDEGFVGEVLALEDVDGPFAVFPVEEEGAGRKLNQVLLRHCFYNCDFYL